VSDILCGDYYGGVNLYPVYPYDSTAAIATITFTKKTAVVTGYDGSQAIFEIVDRNYFIPGETWYLLVISPYLYLSYAYSPADSYGQTLLASIVATGQFLANNGGNAFSTMRVLAAGPGGISNVTFKM
jgi:hypothetical protein